jgi:general secretion pathway protein E
MSAISWSAKATTPGKAWLSTNLEDSRYELEAAFAEFLVAQNVTDRSTLERAESAARKTGERLDRVMTKLGLLSESDLAAALSRFLPAGRAGRCPDGACSR